MNKEPTRTIYSYLGASFWTTRKCQHCQNFFTPVDYQTTNYQLFFQEAFALDHSRLSVMVQLSHQECCGINYQSEIY